MRYLSVCSGIGGDHVAWAPLGWECAAFAEIDPQASAVLAHHYPEIPNHGDFTTIKGDEYGPVDLVCGGTPCQAFSVAGLRRGMDDDRGNLSLEFCRLVGRCRPRWVVWENVPGVLSLVDGGVRGGAFLSIVRALTELGYGVCWHVHDAQYVRVESHPYAVPQRRRRVFLVGYLGNWRPSAAVCLEPQSMRRDHPPRRDAGKAVAGTFSARAQGGGGLGTDFEADGGLIAGTLTSHPRPDGKGGSDLGTDFMLDGGLVSYAGRSDGPVDVSPSLLGHHGHIDFESEALSVSHALTAERHDAGEDGSGRGQPLVAMAVSTEQEPKVSVEVSPTRKQPFPSGGGQPMVVAFDARQNEVLVYGDKSGPIDTGVPPVAVAVCENQGYPAVQTDMMVRRITPKEAERLQGFPDSWTAVSYRGKPMADGPRYRMLGNAWAVNCARWLGERIQVFEEVVL